MPDIVHQSNGIPVAGLFITVASAVLYAAGGLLLPQGGPDHTFLLTRDEFQTACLYVMLVGMFVLVLELVLWFRKHR